MTSIISDVLRSFPWGSSSSKFVGSGSSSFSGVSDDSIYDVQSPNTLLSHSSSFFESSSSYSGVPNVAELWDDHCNIKLSDVRHILSGEEFPKLRVSVSARRRVPSTLFAESEAGEKALAKGGGGAKEDKHAEIKNEEDLALAEKKAKVHEKEEEIAKRRSERLREEEAKHDEEESAQLRGTIAWFITMALGVAGALWAFRQAMLAEARTEAQMQELLRNENRQNQDRTRDRTQL